MTEYGLNQCVGVGIVESDFEKGKKHTPKTHFY